MKRPRELPTQDRLTHAFHYDPATGHFTWKNPILTSTMKPGDKAGYLSDGYVKIKLDDVAYYGHRLAWVYVYGDDSLDAFTKIEHINEVRHDNRLMNLRTQNDQDGRRRSECDLVGLSGIHEYRPGRFRVQGRIGDQTVDLGMSDSAVQAARVYASWAEEGKPSQ